MNDSYWGPVFVDSLEEHFEANTVAILFCYAGTDNIG